MNKMTREQLEQYFVENREIQYGDLTLGIMDWGDGRFDVLSPADNEDGYEVINEEPYDCPHNAIDFTINYILKHEKEVEEAAKEKTKSKTKNKKVKEVEPAYDGPRTIKVFGRDIYIEDDSKLSYEDIRCKLVEEYDFPNFKKDKTMYDFDASTGTLEVMLKFKTKG